MIEEVGVRDAELTGPIWSLVSHFSWNGRPCEQHDEFFVARLETRVDIGGDFDVGALESEGIHEQRWWPVEEIDGLKTGPEDLAARIRSLLADQ